MNKVNKIVLIEVPDKPIKRRTPIIKHPYYPPLRDLEEKRLPKDTFQRSDKIKKKQ